MSRKEKPHNPTVEHLQKLHRRRMAVFGAVILLAGMVIGGAIMLIAGPHRKPAKGPNMASIMMLRGLQDELRLSPEQQEKLQPILKTSFEALDEIRKKAQPEIDAQLTQMNEQISAILTGKQRQLWQKRLEDLQRRFRGGPRRGGGGPGSGFRRGPGEPEHFRNGPGQFGPQRRPGDSNRPRDGFGRDAMPDRFRRGSGPPAGPGRRPEDMNFPWTDLGRDARFRPGRGQFGTGRRRPDPNRTPDDPNQGPAIDPTRKVE